MPKNGKVLESKHQIGPHGFRTVILDSEGNRLALHSRDAHDQSRLSRENPTYGRF